MTVKELKEKLNSYPDDMEVVVFREWNVGHHEFYDSDFILVTNNDNQLVID